ncbi:SDR family oxidoreductase [Tsuneonella rigui]|jgi:NAD(P)-dependent dehydrogenase (short-subunit alcohol dehydrogenase family)|uniref:SDR family oxidoreductase n=1 Tax=Tsuneonella rigui TaxID=1708790 RepID=UPI0013DEEA6C|nr:SDR family oxidoreductase [Tsuneonella rigui]
MGALNLNGKRVLITGAGGGVGRALAQRMADEGAALLLTDRNTETLDAVLGDLGESGACTVAADLGSPEGVERLFAEVDAQLGGLDIMVACAGIGSEPLMAFHDESWRDVITSNLVSYVACTRRAIDRIRKASRGEGSVILLGSISVHIKAVGESVYNAAKGGVASFAETLRKELIPDAIRVTLIEPGAIGSAMQPFNAEERARLIAAEELLPPGEVAEAVMFAATRPVGVDCVTLRIEPMVQKIY